MTTETNKKKLVELLDKSEHLAGQFFSAEEFHLTLVDSITKIKNGDSVLSIKVLATNVANNK